MKPHRLAHGLDLVFQNAAYVAFSFLRHLAPFFTPAAPAFFFGHAVYMAAVKTTVWQLAAFVGIVAALGLESAGIMASHTAIKFYSSKEHGKMWAAIVLSALYLIAGIGSIVLFDGTEWDSKIVGIAMFCISGIVYAVLGLVADTVNLEARADKESDNQAELKRIELANQLTERLAIVGAKKEIAITKATSAPLQIATKAEPKAESKAKQSKSKGISLEPTPYQCPSCETYYIAQPYLSGHGPKRCAAKRNA